MEQFTVVEELGRGAFGKVSKIQRNTDGKVLVWKELHFGDMSKKEKEMLVSEVNILRELRHPHIVRYYNHIIDSQSKKIYIVMEHCEGGDLRSLIKEHERENRKFDEEFVWRTMTQLCIALKECHDRRIIHRDIKPANILLDANWNVKLGDFGLARILSENSYARTHVGTPLYLAPELTRDETYDTKADLWSLGCVLYEMCALRPPFSASNHVALALKIRSGRYPPLDSRTERCSSELARALGTLLRVDTSKRSSVDDLLRLPHVRLKLRERKLNQHYNLLKRREEELMRREKELDARERSLQEWENRLQSPKAAHAAGQHADGDGSGAVWAAFRVPSISDK